MIQKITLYGLLLFTFSSCLTPNYYDNMEEDGDLTKIAKWKIENGELKEVIILKQHLAKESVDSIAQIWSNIKSILPKEPLKKYVKEFVLLTDGPSETLAGVAPLDKTNKYWDFAVDPEDLPKGDFKKEVDFLHTLIHEFGHIITLNHTQIDPSDLEYQTDEKRYLTSEGLAKKKSYINLFVQTFWYPNDRLLEWDKIDRMPNESRRLRKLFSFYQKYEEDFLTDYAAESPEEDLAESWYFFVIQDKPTANLNKNKKILFFYQFEELLLLRKEIRSATR